MHNNHDGHCEECAAQALPPDEQQARAAELLVQESLWLKEHGFYTHWVAPRVGHPEDGPHQSHTHGLPQTCGHLDLQIKLGLRGNIANGIFHTVVKRIKAGERFEPGMDYAGILQGDYKVRMVEAVENGRQVLRIIIPPKNGNLNRADMHDPSFERQYDD